MVIFCPSWLSNLPFRTALWFGCSQPFLSDRHLVWQFLSHSKVSRIPCSAIIKLVGGWTLGLCDTLWRSKAVGTLMNMSRIFDTNIVSFLETRMNCPTLLVCVTLVVFLCTVDSLANISRFFLAGVGRSYVQVGCHFAIGMLSVTLVLRFSKVGVREL